MSRILEARRDRERWFEEATSVLLGGVWVDVLPGTHETIQTPWIRWETATGTVLVNQDMIAAIRVLTR